MNKKFKIKKGDKVVVLAGRDKGMTGEVKQIMTEEDKVVVAGVNARTKHRKPSQTNPGGIEKVEMPIHISNVAIADPKDGKATRIGFKADGDKKVRVAKRSGEQVE